MKSVASGTAYMQHGELLMKALELLMATATAWLRVVYLSS